MMSRGIGLPTLSWRKPVSMMCEISVLICDDLAALGLRRNVDEGARGHQIRSSRQAPSVMITSTVSDQNEPSDISQMATTVCVSASRTRVWISALPARGPELDADHVGLRVLLGEDVDRLDVILRRHRAVDRDAIATVLPFSTSGGRSSLILPGLTAASPTTWRMADFIVFGRCLRRPHDKRRDPRRRWRPGRARRVGDGVRLHAQSFSVFR